MGIGPLTGPPGAAPPKNGQLVAYETPVGGLPASWWLTGLGRCESWPAANFWHSAGSWWIYRTGGEAEVPVGRLPGKVVRWGGLNSVEIYIGVPGLKGG